MQTADYRLQAYKMQTGYKMGQVYFAGCRLQVETTFRNITHAVRQRMMASRLALAQLAVKLAQLKVSLILTKD